MNILNKLLLVLILFFCVIFVGMLLNKESQSKTVIDSAENYWFVLYRKSNTEELYKGIPGDKQNSQLIKTFTVKTGIPGERPTPLPQLMGRDYWVIIEKHEEKENPETAPYFITLDIPAPIDPPYGPVPYEECNGEQCDWVRPGYFGLHGVAGDPSRLSEEDLGSSGCIRHSDEDITYIYNLIDPHKEQIRYYVEDK